MDYKSFTVMFQPPYKYGKELYDWHISQYQENPNYYPSQKDYREFILQNDLDPYGYTKERYTTIPLTIGKKLFMPLGELKKHVLRLKIKAIEDRQAYFFERHDMKATCEFDIISDQNLAFVSMYWDERKYTESFVIKFQDEEEDVLDIIKTIVSSFEFSLNEIPEKSETLIQLISEELNQQN